MNFCGICGNKLKENVNFCGIRGQKIETEKIHDKRSHSFNYQKPKEIVENKKPNDSHLTNNPIKKYLVYVFILVTYIALVWIQVGVFAFINLQATGRPTGGITAIGVISFWTSYKVCKWIKTNYLQQHLN